MELTPERLLAIFKSTPGRPLSVRQATEILGLPRPSQRIVWNMLQALVREGRLVRLRKKHFILPKPAGHAEGKIHISTRGAGFVLGAGRDGEDLYVHRSNTGTAVEGDRVEVEIVPGRRGESEGRVVRVIERAHRFIVGQFSRRGLGGVVVPRNVKIGRWAELRTAPPPEELPDGAWVRVEVEDWPGDSALPLPAALDRIVGLPGERGIAVEALLQDLGVEQEFSEAVLRQAAAFKAPATEEEIARRLDLRKEKIFTIDPARAKDFDDAISIEKSVEGRWRLGVHIADVAHYVRPGTPVDVEGLERATSIYPVDRVVPMLPERLSNDLCSLRPNEDRYALSCIMTIDGRGSVLDHEIAETTIHSHRRLNYEEVQAYFDAPESVRAEMDCADVGEQLLEARELARILNRRRMERGALDLDMPEPEIELDEEAEVVALRRHERHESNRLVEEFMLIANETVAERMRKEHLPTLYRNHDPPDPSALEKVAPALQAFGVKIPKNVAPTPEFFQPIVNRLRDRDGGHIGQRLVLTSMMRAQYAPENHGHFGLASEAYLHFTSPIRRYPDLLTHRVLKRWLQGRADEEWRAETEAALDGIAEQCNTQAERSERIEWDAAAVKSMEFMTSRIGDVYDAWVSGIQSKGFFAELVELPVEGFVHVKTLEDDHYESDEHRSRLTGANTGRTFRLGQRVQVQVMRVEVAQGEMDLEVPEARRRPEAVARPRRKRG